MPSTWITTSSTHVEAMVNSINAAADRGFVPDRYHFMENPEVEDAVASAIEHTTRIVEAYGGDEPIVERTAVDDELEFDRIRKHVRDAIEGAREREDEVAVDITPGRKFMSAIAFAAGMRYGADHVFYFYLSSANYYGRLYPEIPRTATKLFDLAEET